MKQAVLTVLLLAIPPAPVKGEPLSARPLSTTTAWTSRAESSLAGQDPLLRQILHRQITQRNGGITAAVRIGSGQSIELRLAELDNMPVTELKNASGAPVDLLAALKPTAGLVADETGKPSPAEKSSTTEKPAEQLQVLHQQGTKQAWGGTAKTGAEKVPSPEVAPRATD